MLDLYKWTFWFGIVLWETSMSVYLLLANEEIKMNNTAVAFKHTLMEISWNMWKIAQSDIQSFFEILFVMWNIYLKFWFLFKSFLFTFSHVNQLCSGT